jgi:sugar/nucleoside kinase (ribokinase family)
LNFIKEKATRPFKTFPMVFCDGKFVGGFVETDRLVMDFDEAVELLRRDCHIAAVTRSEKGSVIVTRDDVHEVPAAPVPQVVDTTGAGDLFAAGFLRGLTQGKDLTSCARIGAIAAAEVISHVGPRPLVSLTSLLPADLQ